MWIGVLHLSLALLIGAGAPAQKHRSAGSHRAGTKPAACGDVLAFQILLDRNAFSPGQIDGKAGPNLARAVAAFQKARTLPATGRLDCATWRALGGNQAGQLLAPYTIGEDDVNAAYVENIPADLEEQATLPSLGYSSVLERLAERFHSSPALLQKLNKGTALAAGTTIKVPAVKPFDPARKPPPDLPAADLSILVSKTDSALRAVKPDGTIVFFAPVTTGSEHDPLPLGDWTVKGVQWNPSFHYNPDLFWDAEAGQSKATIKPGPNNPVGVVWIDLDLEHYGLHGTPDPENVGHTASHGCVRLTNWDAARVASLVRTGTPVRFR